MPQMRYDIDSRQKQRLPNAMKKYTQLLDNLVEFKLTDFEEIDSPIKKLENKTVRELIMNLKSKSGDKLFLAIERSWNGELTLWAKRKFKTEAETCSAYMAAWLANMHGDCIISKLDPDMQNLVKSVEWRDGMPLYPEEAEIEDASKINIDWLIDMTDLDIAEGDDKSVAMDDTSIISFGDKSFFSVNQTVQYQEDEFQRDTYQSLALSHLDTSASDMEYTVDQTTTNALVQGSQGVEGHGKPSALT